VPIQATRSGQSRDYLRFAAQRSLSTINFGGNISIFLNGLGGAGDPDAKSFGASYLLGATHQILAVNKHHPPAAVKVVRTDYRESGEGHRAQAQDRLRELLQKRPKESTALLLSARLHMADGKRAEARQAAAW